MTKVQRRESIREVERGSAMMVVLVPTEQEYSKSEKRKRFINRDQDLRKHEIGGKGGTTRGNIACMGDKTVAFDVQ